MKRYFHQILAVLALAVLFAAPAAAADSLQAVTDTPACNASSMSFEMMDQAVPVQNPPVPDRGYACELPPQQRDEDCVCPFVFDPVCGCNGETYSNACFASCEVRFFTEGEC